MGARDLVRIRGACAGAVLLLVAAASLVGCRAFRPAAMERREAGEEEIALGIESVHKKDTVEIEGRFDAGRFLANRIEIENDDNEVELIGDLESLDLARGTGSIGGVGFRISERSKFAGLDGEETDRGAFVPGVRVKAECDWRDGTRTLQKIRIRERDPEEWDSIQGPLEEIGHSDGRMVLGGIQVEFPPDVLVIWDRDEPAPLGSYDRKRFAIARAPGGLRKIWRLDTEDRRPIEQLTIGDVVTVGGEVQYDSQWRNNHDLNNKRDRDRLVTGFSSKLELSFDLSEHVFAFVQGRVQKEYVVCDEDDDLDYDWQFRLGESFVFLSDIPANGTALQLGRQDFDQGREWVMDENLDAARAWFNLDAGLLEVSASTIIFGANNQQEGIKNYLVALHSEPYPDNQLFTYALYRYGGTMTFLERWHLGVSAEGEIGILEYWADAGYAFGKEDDQEIAGWGVDVAAMHVFDDVPLEPSLVAGIAHGSGDSDPDSGTDRNFRQTGLHDNNDKFNGVTSFRYLGELVRPDVSNLQILTAAFGIRPLGRTSVDFVFHRYRQVEAADFLINTRLRKQPNGESKRIGSEIDMIVGLEYYRPLEIEFVVAWFNPGGAFDDPSDAWFATLQVEYNF